MGLNPDAHARLYHPRFTSVKANGFRDGGKMLRVPLPARQYEPVDIVACLKSGRAVLNEFLKMLSSTSLEAINGSP